MRAHRANRSPSSGTTDPLTHAPPKRNGLCDLLCTWLPATQIDHIQLDGGSTHITHDHDVRKSQPWSQRFQRRVRSMAVFWGPDSVWAMVLSSPRA
eukprot:4682015-Prymnesium_polylepis.1